MKSVSSQQQTLKVTFQVEPEAQEVLIAVLGQGAFEAFQEGPDALDAYVSAKDFSEEWVSEMLGTFFPGREIPFASEPMPDKDWNEEWEKSFSGVTVDDFCEIIPPFKEPSGETQYVIRIHPKMAFGTGHHATTRLMCRQMAHLDLQGKSLLDMGTGTGVLAILASKLGANPVTGIDIDEWSYRNALENLELNKIENVEILLGGSDAIPEELFHVIFANINRNVLIADMAVYAARLHQGGFLALSGFFLSDEIQLTTTAAGLGFSLVRKETDQEWMSLVFKKEIN